MSRFTFLPKKFATSRKKVAQSWGRAREVRESETCGARGKLKKTRNFQYAGAEEILDFLKRSKKHVLPVRRSLEWKKNTFFGHAMLATVIRFMTLGAQSKYGNTTALPDRIK